MHPVIAHFLDPKSVRSALDKSARGEPLSELEVLFVNAATAHPDRKERAMNASSNGDMEDQQAALALAVFAALAQVEQDPVLSPIVQQARRALLEAGATDDDVQQFLSLVLLEEAFAFEDEADTFDTDLVAETFRTLPRLAGLDEERVTKLEETFVHNVTAEQRPLLLATVEALFSAAWSDGPVPVSPEHVEGALEQLRGQTSDVDFQAAVKALQSLLQLLAREGLIGLQRLKRLLDAMGPMAAALSAPVEDDESDLGEDDDGEDG
ncbi:MAG: hypothetical protein H6Q89_2015, partial [Myxococcaceae bacterium]|nr:hypothetical protein [Myxococcaceae bacterium]